MQLPYFYISELTDIQQQILDEETSKHIVQVLRMKIGEELLLTNGNGMKVKGVIVDNHRKHCKIHIQSIQNENPLLPQVIIAISLIKNTSRFEWFLEKATEIGVYQIIPLLCERTEKEKFRYERLNTIIISAMLQSQQCWLPQLYQPTSFEKVIHENAAMNKYIAHCRDVEKQSLVDQSTTSSNHHIILIGPEGDFTEYEIELAHQNGFQPVSLGKTRLRSETAGIVAAALLCNK